MLDLRQVYQASSRKVAEQYLLELGEKCGKKYPAFIKSWHANWETLTQYFKYPFAALKVRATLNNFQCVFWPTAVLN